MKCAHDLGKIEWPVAARDYAGREYAGGMGTLPIMAHHQRTHTGEMGTLPRENGLWLEGLYGWNGHVNKGEWPAVNKGLELSASDTDACVEMGVPCWQG